MLQICHRASLPYNPSSRVGSFFNFKTVQPLAPLGPTEEQAKLSIYSVSSLTNSLHKAISGQLWPSSGSGDDQRRWAIDGSGPHALAIFLSWPKTVSFGSRVPFELEEKVFVGACARRLPFRALKEEDTAS